MSQEDPISMSLYFACALGPIVSLWGAPSKVSDSNSFYHVSRDDIWDLAYAANVT